MEVLRRLRKKAMGDVRTHSGHHRERAPRILWRLPTPLVLSQQLAVFCNIQTQCFQDQRGVGVVYFRYQYDSQWGYNWKNYASVMFLEVYRDKADEDTDLFLEERTNTMLQLGCLLDFDTMLR